MKNFLCSSLFICALLVSGTACAATPSVTSFIITPSAISNDLDVNLSWTIANGTGHDVYISCPTGVTLKNKITGVSVPCGTRQPFSSSISDSVGLTVTNVSGTTAHVSATVYPKDDTGADYDAGALSASFTVTSVYQPITSFLVSTTTVASGGNVTFTWTGIDVPGMSIQLDCTDGVQFFDAAATNTPLVCGTRAYTTNLQPSGSLTLAVKNSRTTAADVTAHLIPAITSALYDGTHAQSIYFTVQGAAPVSSPSVVSFTSAASTVSSGAPVVFTWVTQATAAANIQFPCVDGLVFQAMNGSTTTPLSCGTTAFSPSLAVSGSTTVAFVNQRAYTQYANIVLLPGDALGQYYATAAQSVRISVLASGAALSPIIPAPTPATTAASSRSMNIGAHIPFTLPMTVGSRGAQVMALQKFLALNSTIYPDGSASGYFGALTKAAVQRFQMKYGLAKPGDEGYGFVGPKTRAKMNALATP